MNPDQLTSLEPKKSCLQKKIQDKEDISRLIEHWIDIYNRILQHDIDCKTEFLHCVEEEIFEPWREALESAALANFSLDDKTIFRKGIVCFQKRLEENFPGIYPFRYMPELAYRINLPESPARIIIQNALNSLGVSNEPVYIFINRFTPVIKMNSADVPEIASYLTELREDICILAETEQWLIFRSLDEEWRWGFQNKQLALYAEGSRPLYIHSRSSSMSEMVRVLNIAAPVMNAEFQPKELFTVMNKFLLSGADTRTFIIRGTFVWIEISFEKHEGYLFWHCYTFDANQVDRWKDFFSRL